MNKKDINNYEKKEENGDLLLGFTAFICVGITFSAALMVLNIIKNNTLSVIQSFEIGFGLSGALILIPLAIILILAFIIKQKRFKEIICKRI